jgi:coenzyme F420 hydrogenase subunit beta
MSPLSLPVLESVPGSGASHVASALTTLPGHPSVLMPTPGEARSRDLCTDCGVSRSGDPSRCGIACQFIHPRYGALERQVHGRARDPERGDERFFGPHRRMVRGSLVPSRAGEGAQWTGITTRIGERLLETGAVDAVLAVAPHPDDRWRPVPVLVTEPEGMAACRGMRMGYAPLLSLLEPAAALGYRRLAVVGIPCQIHALRALEASLGLERLYVVGIPCSDNTTTENFHDFLALLDDDPDGIEYLEFRADYRVEVRRSDGTVREIPFLNLPISQLPDDFFPLPCRTCVDYTNSLADLTVGYMGGEGEQWLVVRNQRGEELVALLGQELEASPAGSAGDRTRAVQGFLANVRRAAGGLPLRRTPSLLRPLVNWLMPRVGPKGLEFARARVEMKALETVLHLRRERPRRMRRMIPPHVWALVAPYGLAPESSEVP